MIRAILFTWLVLMGIGAAYAQDPYLYQLQQQTLLMQQQQLDNMRYQQQQQLQYNRRGVVYDPTIQMQASQMPDIAGSYAEGYARGQQQRLMQLEIERLEAEAEARESAAIRQDSNKRQDALLEAARLKYR